jgi:hypothetical protein
MSLAMPIEVRDRIRSKLWAKADELSWTRINVLERAKWYENWTRDKDVGGVISHFMDPRKVRVYIKDCLLKAYLRERLQNDWERVRRALEIDEQQQDFVRKFYKPHGRELADGKIISWGGGRDWKLILISVFERAFVSGAATPYAAVMFETGKTTNMDVQAMAVEAGGRLGLAKVVWTD